jgi:hypothetical protein
MRRYRYEEGHPNRFAVCGHCDRSALRTRMTRIVLQMIAGEDFCCDECEQSRDREG